MGYSRKNAKRGQLCMWGEGWGERRGVEDIEFLGVLKKKHVEIPGVN